MKKIILILIVVGVGYYFIKSENFEDVINIEKITTIAKLKSSPLKEGQKVSIEGIVTESANLGFGSYFILKDPTGSIKVISDTAPLEYTKLYVEGKYHQFLKFGKTEITAIKATKITVK